MPEQGAEVNARIVYWGVPGAGKRTNLQLIHSKLRPDHRGDLCEIPTRLDPTVTYAAMPIELGAVGGVRTRIQVYTTPEGPEHAPSRKQLLDRVDGIVFVVDTARERLDENLASFEELRGALAAYGRQLEDVPLVIQYNKRDLSDPFALEELHRKLSMRGVAAFESVARDGTAVLQTLTTISKRVIRHLREQANQPQTPERPAAPAPPPGTTQILDRAAIADLDPMPLEVPASGNLPPAGIDPADLAAPDPAGEAAHTAAQAQSLFEGDFQNVTRGAEPAPTIVDGPAPGAVLEIASVGEAQKAGPRAIQVPVELQDKLGRKRSVRLTVQIDLETD